MHNLSYENEFYLHVNNSLFSVIGCAPRLALQTRYKTTRKWPVKSHTFAKSTIQIRIRVEFLDDVGC